MQEATSGGSIPPSSIAAQPRVALLLNHEPQFDTWRAAARRLQAECVLVRTTTDCAAYASEERPLVIVASVNNRFDAALADRSDPTFGRIALITTCDNADSIAFWRIAAWDAVLETESEAEATSVLEPAIAEAEKRLAEWRLREDYDARYGSLNEKEARVFESICRGRLNKQIASELSVSVRTVEQRRRRVFDKMGVESAVPLAALSATVRTLDEQWRRCRRSAGPLSVVNVPFKPAQSAPQSIPKPNFAAAFKSPQNAATLY